MKKIYGQAIFKARARRVLTLKRFQEVYLSKRAIQELYDNCKCRTHEYHEFHLCCKFRCRWFASTKISQI